MPATIIFGRFLLALIPFATTTVIANDISCKAVAITDGDTFTCLTAQHHQIKVRMAEIDTPERKQPYGEKAKQALAGLVYGKQVSLQVVDKDRYKRTVARVHQGSIDVNRELVSSGAAWVYRQYNRDKSLLLVEANAKAARRGLWGLPEAEQIAPWEWRKRK